MNMTENNQNQANLFTAIKYYLSSIPTLFRIRNFWRIPFLLTKKQVLFELDNNLKFYLEELMDVWVIKEIIFDQHYERIRKIKAGDIIIDIGAAFGDFSIYAAQKAKRVIAYDLNIKRIEILKKNVTLNNTKNVIVNNKAVSSLDLVFEENQLMKCHFLKVDCEGCEYRIFEKASPKTLTKIEYIAMEIHLFDQDMQKSFIGLKSKLIKNGFSIKEFGNPVHNYLRLFFAWKNRQE